MLIRLAYLYQSTNKYVLILFKLCFLFFIVHLTLGFFSKYIIFNIKLPNYDLRTGRKR